LVHFAGANLVSGFDLVGGLLDLDSRIRAADLVVTGEGSLDGQSLGGKAPVALARRARELGKPVVAFCGSVDAGLRDSKIFDQVFALSDMGLPLDTLMREASSLLAEMAAGVRLG
jgi:glycerate kinase